MKATTSTSLDVVSLNQSVKTIWENSQFPFLFQHGFTEFPESTECIKVDVDVFSKYGWIKTPDIIAYELTNSLMAELGKTVRHGSTIKLYPTVENIFANLFQGTEHIASATDRCVTAYYNGNLDLNPPHMAAWLVINFEVEGNKKNG